MNIAMTKFAAERHFDPNFSGTFIPKMTPEKFIEDLSRQSCIMKPGYAPFCKLMFVGNWTKAKTGTMRITEHNKRFLKSGYKARREGELPVLTRWFEGINVPTANFLCIVLYDKEQLDKEGSEVIDADYGIVSILAQSISTEQPMSPITIMRNALGIEEGGSGVPLDREKYLESVEFWDKNAIVSNGE